MKTSASKLFESTGRFQSAHSQQSNSPKQRSQVYHQQRDQSHHRDHHVQSSRNIYVSSAHLSRHSYSDPFSDPESLIKSDRSHPTSPVNCDLKPDSLVGDGGSVNGLSNALLGLASLGSLAALQQAIPNFMTNAVGNHIPLNLTNSITREQSQSSTQKKSPPHHGQNVPNLPSPNSVISSAIASLAGAGGGLPPSINGPIPQLILASGHLSNGIQGAQILIPTSQGIMSQTVLTIPITQPASPSGVLGSTPSHFPLQQVPVPPGPVAGQKRYHHQLHSPQSGLSLSQRNLIHPQSPTIASAAPHQRGRESVSPEIHQERSRIIAGNFGHYMSQQVGGNMHTIPEKVSTEQDSSGGLNGNLIGHQRKEKESRGGPTYSQKSSPCSREDSMQEHENESDKFSDTEDDQMVDGINLDEIKEFAKAFKLRRLSLGLTQTQVGQALSGNVEQCNNNLYLMPFYDNSTVTEGPAYSQSAICSALAWQLAQSQSYPSTIHQKSMFEKLDITPKSAQKIKPVLERWMKEAEERYKNGHQNLNEFVGMEPSKKRKRRTSFTPQALEILNNHFERNTHPSGAEITTLAHQLGYEREVIRIWFCNKRQALKNTVRMMSKGSSPM